MPVKCRKYKTSRQHIRQAEPAYLASFLEKQLPGAQFRFITFEKDDYNRGGVTFLLCQSIPEKAIISVEYAVDLEPAILRIIKLNPSILWNTVDFTYPKLAVRLTGEVFVELWFGGFHGSIDALGRLNRGSLIS